MAVSFEPEAFYWFLYPLMKKLLESRGKYIHLWGDCEFAPREIDLIFNFVSRAEALVRQQRDVFRVHMGTQTQPVKRELYTEVDRASLLAFLGSLRLAADQCLQMGKSLHFYGD